MTAESLPPSAEFVRYVLAERGPTSRPDLLDETNRAESTLDYALDVLEEEGLLIRRDTSPVEYELHQ